jgi:hypothetical protein
LKTDEKGNQVLTAAACYWEAAGASKISAPGPDKVRGKASMDFPGSGVN